MNPEPPVPFLPNHFLGQENNLEEMCLLLKAS